MKATLIGVDKIYFTSNTHVVVSKDATVGTYGGKYDGGNCSNVKAALGGVDKIYSIDYAFLLFCRIRLW